VREILVNKVVNKITNRIIPESIREIHLVRGSKFPFTAKLINPIEINTNPISTPTLAILAKIVSWSCNACQIYQLLILILLY
jgi:hypothetical protein